MSDDLAAEPVATPASGADHGPGGYPSLEQLGQLLPHYELQRQIGLGGMGAVYLARQPSLDRWVAIKVLAPSMAQHPEEEVRFIKEARAMARLMHPHIVAVFDFGRTDAGHLYLVMEYVEGRDLHWRTRAGEITPERARLVIAQICEALQFAHEHGVVHRDIKPANILITSDWQVKVADFGLAREGTLLAGIDEPEYGTPDYSAPERFITGMPIDHRADIYSLGVVIHEILTGLTPRAAGTLAGQGLPEGFAGVLSKCLMHDPARRYQSAGEVRAALLAEAKPGAPVKSGPALPPPSRPAERRPVPSMRRLPARGRVANVGWGMCCVAALGGLTWLVWRDHYQPLKSEQGGDGAVAMAGPVFENPAERLAKAPPEVLQESPAMKNAVPAALLLAASTAFGVDYQSQVVPILRTKCYDCHSVAKGKEKGDVALDTQEKLSAHIGPGQHIVPGEPAKSTMLIICKLPDDDEDVMPPKGKNRLTADELMTLETWIKEGATLAAGSKPAPAPAAASTSWTSNDGKTIEATFVALEGANIKLRLTATGVEYTFPLSRLSAESQAQAKAAAK